MTAVYLVWFMLLDQERIVSIMPMYDMNDCLYGQTHIELYPDLPKPRCVRMTRMQATEMYELQWEM